jgi:hypothetical protein
MTPPLRKSLSGLSGVGVLTVTLYFSCVVGSGMYNDYILFPKEKAEDHYIAPTRWQDFTFLAIFWTTAILLMFAAFRLLRFALKRQLSR